MTKRFYVRYHESRSDLLLSQSAQVVMRTSFHAGCVVSRFSGFRTKRDAMDWIAKVNAAAGKTIAEFGGAFESPKGMDSHNV